MDTVSGTASVGGIAGYAKSTISNCNANVNSIRDGVFPEDTSKDERFQLYIGGIAGYTVGKIQNSTVLASNVGNGNVGMNDQSIDIDIVGIEINDINKYIVGGIAGYTSAQIVNTTIDETVQVKGGKILYTNDISKPDPKGFNATGGIIGYKKSTQNIDNTWQVNINVSGYDNVGGIVGYNDAQCNIKGITRTNPVYGSGENVGGIVGLNTGGQISECINKATITGVTEGSSINYAENVGGIVGLNNGNKISKCYNENTVTGDKNVGGIAGASYGGTIEDCGNKNAITGKNNTNRLNIWYYTGPEDCTGTGGITGKNYAATIIRCYNNGNIICNFNGGGITGLIRGGKIEYSYNTAGITNSQETTTLKSNRLGGIAGAGNTIYINSCYNTGSITGRQDTNVLSNGIGGIIGTTIDNSWFLYIGQTELIPSNKYIGQINVDIIKGGETENSILNCYNTGMISGGATTGQVDFDDVFKDFSLGKLWDFIRGTVNPTDAVNHMCGIVGTILWAPNSSNILLQNNYYYISGSNNVIAGARGSWSNIINGGVTRAASKDDMKHQLYKWATKSFR